MNNLDSIVDAYENAVGEHGVHNVDPCSFLPRDGSESSEGAASRAELLIELLRVWIELRWKAGAPATEVDAMQLAPGHSFSDSERKLLQFEVRRQTRLTQESSSDQVNTLGIDQLPEVGQEWGPFRLLYVLGEGTFAKVFLARQLDMASRLVALKLTFRESHESQLLSRLQHSAIVPIYSVHRVEKVFGICMPYLGCTTLADVLRDPKLLESTFSKSASAAESRSGHPTLLRELHLRQAMIDTAVANAEASTLRVEPLSAPIPAGAKDIGMEGSTAKQGSSITGVSMRDRSQNVDHRGIGSSGQRKHGGHLDFAWIGFQLAEALAHAHEKNVLHCDIKPANILLAEDGQPRLLDFNVSGALGESEVTDSQAIPVGGTIPYMSPEQRRSMETNEPIGPASDIYSLGIVLLEMIVQSSFDTKGRRSLLHPKSGTSDSDLEKRIRYLRSVASPALCAIVEKCLSQNPDQRYGSARELSDDLNAHYRSLPLVHLREPSVLERTQKWARRHPKVSSTASVGIVSVVLLLAACTLALWRGSQLDRMDRLQRLQTMAQKLPSVIAIWSASADDTSLKPILFSELHSALLLGLNKKRGISISPELLEQNDEMRQVRQDLDFLIEMLADETEAMSSYDSKSNEAHSIPFASLMKSFDSQLKAKGANLTSGSPSEARSTSIAKNISERNWVAAKKELESRIEDLPADYSAHWLLGDCLLQMADKERAIQEYSFCIALRPEIALSYFKRASVYMLQEEYALAEADFEKASQTGSPWNWARYNRAIALQRLGSFEAAREEITKAIDDGLQNVSSYKLRAEILDGLRLHQQSSEDVTKALNCSPQTEAEWIDRGLLLLGANPKESVSSFEKALTLAPNSLDARQKLAFVHSEMLGDLPKSLHYSNELVSLAPDKVHFRAGRAVLLARMGDRGKAIADLSRCVAFPNRVPLITYQLACGYSLVCSPQTESPSKSELDGSQKSLCMRTGIQLLITAIAADPNLLSIVDKDPDIAFLRSQREYQEISQYFTSVNTVEKQL